jgi:glycosyltransferase involved in cell wall biosynthesis
VLFASSPSTPDQFGLRGIPLLVEAARRCPDLDIKLLWRNWGNVDALKKAMAVLNPPANLINVWQDVSDMAHMHQAAHVVAYLPHEGYGKSSPNSVLEALACGCPALVSDSCGVAALVSRTGAGIQVRRDVEAVVRALATLRAEFTRRSAVARSLALSHFNLKTFLSSYRDLYSELELADLGRSRFVAADHEQVAR